mgnify:CR=1 FL=1
MGQLANIRLALQEVYAAKRYLFLSGGVALFVLSFNLVVNNYRLIFSQFSLPLFFSLLRGSLASIATVSLAFILITAILAGIVVAMATFLVRRQVKHSASSLSSLLISIITPTCPSCAIGLLSVLGLGGFLAFLPFKGLELGVLGIAVLLFFLVFLSKKIMTTTCTIKK